MEVPVTSIDDQITLVDLVLDPTSTVPIRLAPTSSTSTTSTTAFPSSITQADLSRVNELAMLLLAKPGMLFPPPPMPVPNVLSQHINKAKEDGNTHFRAGNVPESIRLYTLSADLASRRALYESNAYARDELAVTLCNRSAAYAQTGEWINSLVDADAVILLKRPWTKGHFRRGKALMGMKRYNEAREAFLLGLQFDPVSVVRSVSCLYICTGS